MPWWAVFVVVLLTIGLTKGFPAFLKYLGFGFEVEKYRDALKKAERDDLVAELKQRIEELAKEVAEIKLEARQERLDAAKRLADEQAAHAKCELSMAELKGDMKVMQEKIRSLETHEKTNTQNVEKLAEEVKKHTEPNP